MSNITTPITWVKQEPEEVDPLLLLNEEGVSSTIAKNVTYVTQLPISISTDAEYKPPHKLKKREMLDRQARIIVANVNSYMDMEKAAMNFLIPPEKAQMRTAMACGVGKTTVMRVTAESRNIQNNIQDDFKTTGCSRAKKSPCSGLETKDIEACRTLLFKTIIESDHSIDCTTMHRKFLESKLFSAGRSSFRRFMKNLGIQVKRTRSMGRGGQKKGKGSMIVEEHNVQYQKYVYLRDLKKYKSEGRPIIFTAMTKLARAHCKADKGEQPAMGGQALKVTEDMFADVQDELSREEWRAVLLDAGDKSGFVTGGFLIWRCTKKLGSNNLYDENANYRKYVKWVNDNLIPNIPEGAVVVLHHEAIYDRHEDPIPTQSSAKEDMKAWLKRKGIDFESEAPKVELYELIKKNKRNHSKFEIDSILEESGHPVLRIPQNYNELNPMMDMLKEVKTWMKGQSPNVNPRFVDMAKLTVSKMLSTPPETWTSKVEKCQAIAEKYFSFQAPMEKKISEAISANNGLIDSESEENDDSESNEEGDVSSSEGSEETTKHRTSNADDNMWVTPLPTVFMAGDDFRSTSDSQPTMKRTSTKKAPAVKRQKIRDSSDSQDSNEWNLDGMVTI